MTKPFLNVKRRPYEEPHHTQLEITVSNGRFQGWTDIYCNVEDLTEIGEALIRFPSKAGDEYIYEYGTDDPKAQFYRLFRMRTYTINNSGHCAIQFSINLNQPAPDEGQCQFSFLVEVAALNRLGALFKTFSTLNHLELQWSPAGGSLHETYQVAGA
jgi:hypothetical protein